SAAERQLAAAVDQHDAENGSVVMLEVGTGRILAAANVPTFDPNAQDAFGRDAIQNQAFLRQYEPGSVMKPFVIGALLQAGRLDPKEAIDAPPTLRVGNKTFRDVSAHDPILPVADVLRVSSNTAMLNLSLRFSPQELHAWYRHYGFGESVPMRSAYTRPGQLIPWNRWVPQDQATITIGQAMTTTPLQLAAAYAIFANDGVYLPPRLLDDEASVPPHRVLSSEVARTVRDMLTYTVEESGLRHSRIPGVTVAGKTGTADIWSPEQGTYPDGWYSLTFAGMFPADDPEVVMVVMMQKPDSAATSTYVAAPLFRAIGSEIVAHWGLAPDPEPLVAGASDAP
ncbi:MAG: penicillin-binding transpeptidase domain-containing protein, partial [Trueperaceae bacterium]